MDDIKLYFKFNRGDKIAIIIISVFILIEIITLFLLNSDIFNATNSIKVENIESKFKNDSIVKIAKKETKNNEIPYYSNYYKRDKQNYNCKLNKKIELNSCDTIDLYLLRGIGWVYAKRILKYRNLLGGFINKEQLLEVYGMDKNRYNLFSNDVYVDTSKIKKININDNNLDIRILGKHPYIGFKKAYKIINYRKKNGPYSNILQLLNVIDTNEYLKISKYIDVK